VEDKDGPRRHVLAQFLHVVQGEESALEKGMFVDVDGTLDVTMIELVVKSAVYNDDRVI
jgi:hypothetical protein